MRTVTLDGPRGLRFLAMVPEGRRERMRGLNGRRGLEPDEGQFLERTRSIQTFGTRFTINVALLDRDYVVRSVRRLPPQRLLLPRRGVRHVLELHECADVRPGDRLKLSG